MTAFRVVRHLRPVVCTGSGDVRQGTASYDAATGAYVSSTTHAFLPAPRPLGRASELALVDHVVPDGRALAKAREIATRIAKNGPLAVMAIAATLRENETMPEAAAVAIEQRRGMTVTVSEDAIEGRALFETCEPPFRRR